MHTFYYNIHILPLESVIPHRLSHFFVKWHLFEPVTSDRVAKRLRAATDLHNTVIRCPYAAVVSSILEHPIQVWHSLSQRLPEGRARRKSVLSHQQGHRSAAEIHHGFISAPHTRFVAFYSLVVTACWCFMRPWSRRRWACQAHVHGGYVQRGGAHCTPLCHVLRSMVSKRSLSFSFFTQWVKQILQKYIYYVFYILITTENTKAFLILHWSKPAN